MGKIKKILETELVGGTQSTDVYPVTSTKAVYDTNNKVLDDYIQHLKKTSTFAGIATPTTNPGTPDGPVFYIAGEGTYANFSNIVIEAGQLGILKWNGTWSKEVLEIGAGGGSGGGEGGVVDTAAITKIVNDTIKNVSWWGQKINNNKVDGNIVITKGSHSFTIELDDNGNLKFNGNVYATGGITALGVGTTSGGGSSASLGTLLTKLNSDNPFPTDNGQVLTYDGSNFVWKTPTGGGSGSSSRINNIKLFTNNSDYPFETIGLGTADTIGFMQGDNITFQAVVKDFTNVIKISATGGSGSSGTTTNRLYFRKNGSEESWNGENNFIINFGSGLNVTWDSHSQITLSATGGSGGSTSTSVSWENVTGKPSTFTPSSHTHTTSEITGLSDFKVNNATNADNATKLLNPRLIWGQSFDGTSDINGNLYMSSARGNSIQIWMNNDNILDRTNNTLHIGYGLKQYSNGEINLDAYRTVVYTDNIRNHYDFKSNVFDVNSNQIHFGSETNGGKISWDAANNAFKIEGNVYATGGITALGVSNSSTTSNNVDFTFRSVTITGNNNVQLTDDGLRVSESGDFGAWYKKDSIIMYNSANDDSCEIFRFFDSALVFDPRNYNYDIVFNKVISCNTVGNTLYVGNNSTNGYIAFSAGSTMTFNHNNKNYSFNVAKAIEQGILTI